MVHKLPYYRKSYSDSEEFYNSNNGNLHKMRIKGRKEFIPYIKNFIKIDAVAD